MNKTATKLTGNQVKKLLRNAVGGIYINKSCIHNVVTDFINNKNYMVTDNGLQFEVDIVTTVNIPIQEDKQYINYAIGGRGSETDDPDLEMEWDDSTYFDYDFELSGYSIRFNVTDKGTQLTWVQFKELTDNGNYGIFEVRSIDTGSVYLDIDDCTIAVNDREIEVNSDKVNAIIDRDIIDAIYNDSTDANEISYRLEFDNGMSDMIIEVKYAQRLLR